MRSQHGAIYYALEGQGALITGVAAWGAPLGWPPAPWGLGAPAPSGVAMPAG
jgi:hypothetical protein